MELRTDNLTIPQGATWEVRWPIQNADGTDADLTGWEVRAQARLERRSADVLHEWSTAAGTASVVAGSVALRVSAAESTAWSWTLAVFDVEVFHTDGRVMRVTQGTLEVDSEVTR